MFAARPHFDERDLPEVLASIERVLRSGRLILGEETEALEREFADRVGTKYAVAVSSCSAALEIALRALGANGRRVRVPVNTFIATAVSALRAMTGYVSGEQVGGDGLLDFYDCDDEGNSSAVDAVAHLPPDTAAVVVVHVAGFVPRGMDLLIAECRRRGVALIEDCAHAHGATYFGQHAGALGDVGCFSFYPTKILTCGVGGMLTTDREDVVALARSLRHHGAGCSLEDITGFGSDWLMDEVRAVLARAQLDRLDEVLAHRRAVAARYDEVVDVLGRSCPGLSRLRPVEGSRPSYYKYPVELPGNVDFVRVRVRMREVYGIEVGPLYWPPVHQMPLFAPFGLVLARAETVLRRRLCLPMHGLVDPEDCFKIVEALVSCVEEASP